eukprot:TRINITY_DN562_c0_g1_i1.p3 TRINITY_DN562_c0_g1~~TRINITY_DN562_c0_g1_i1.p3  ORF type:complete len:79 (+),score=15.33 TRINITY_DN562_c0_g1_i1:75-311(+)
MNKATVGWIMAAVGMCGYYIVTGRREAKAILPGLKRDAREEGDRQRENFNRIWVEQMEQKKAQQQDQTITTTTPGPSQ